MVWFISNWEGQCIFGIFWSVLVTPDGSCVSSCIGAKIGVISVAPTVGVTVVAALISHWTVVRVGIALHHSSLATLRVRHFSSILCFGILLRVELLLGLFLGIEIFLFFCIDIGGIFVFFFFGTWCLSLTFLHLHAVEHSQDIVVLLLLHVAEDCS